MDIVVARCAGLDVHKDTVVACVRTPGSDGQRAEQVRTFGTTTVELLGLRDWLVAEEVSLVGMESTGCTGGASTTCWRTRLGAGC
jgi:transposase